MRKLLKIIEVFALWICSGVNMDACRESNYGLATITFIFAAIAAVGLVYGDNKIKIYDNKMKQRYILLTYPDGKVDIYKTRKPFNDIKDFPENQLKPVKCSEISHSKYKDLLKQKMRK